MVALKWANIARCAEVRFSVTEVVPAIKGADNATPAEAMIDLLIKALLFMLTD